MASYTTSTSRPPSQWEPRTSHHQDDPPQPAPHMNGHAATNGHITHTNQEASSAADTTTPTPDPSRSAAALSLRAFLLGLTLGLSILFTLHLLQQSSPLWRLPFFLAVLALFHSLEFYITALFNPSAASTAAFLLNNGRAYDIAHLLAFLECLLHSPPTALLPRIPSLAELLSFLSNKTAYPISSSTLSTDLLAFGLASLVQGQLLRSLAMAQAGQSFNHIVQSKRLPSHTLVTHGVYRFSRHPSYAGFFYWAIGTQLVLGNSVCLVGYSVVLWRFFASRIRAEERLLVKFFGREYVEYRGRTGVGIPFIQ